MIKFVKRLFKNKTEELPEGIILYNEMEKLREEYREKYGTCTCGYRWNCPPLTEIINKCSFCNKIKSGEQQEEREYVIERIKKDENLKEIYMRGRE